MSATLNLENPDGTLSRRALLATAAQLATATVAASAPLSLLAATPAGDPFKVGWVRPTTGRFASSFASLYVTGLMALDEINAAGGILGRPVERVELDDEGSPTKQPGVIKRLKSDNIDYVLGPTGDAQCLASLPTATQSQIVQACFTHGTKPMDGNAYPYSFVLFHSVQMICDLCVDHFHAKGAKRFGLLVENTSTGEAATIAFKATLDRLGLTPTTIQVLPLAGSTATPYITNLRKAGTEVIVNFLGSAPPAAQVLNAMAEQQWFPPITGHAGLLYESLFELVPVESLKNASGVCFKGLTWSDTEAPAPRQIAFARKMLTYPDVTSPYNVASSPFYDFLHLLKHVIEQEKTFDSRRIKTALDNVKGFQGIRCKISFTPENHCGVSVAELAIATALSSKDPRSQGSVFRQRLA